MASIILTTGVPGCGKTYIRCARFLVDDFLVNTRGMHISNFPLNVDAIADHVSAKINKSRGIFGIFRKAVTSDDIKKRLLVIPDDVLQSWRSEISGPWDYFQGFDLKYAHIAIDEIHNFINSRSSSDYLKKWDDFLGEVRHRGCTFEGLTQDFDSVDRVLSGRASIRLELIPGEDLRDPFFKIRLSDWYELKASFLGTYHKTVFMYEKRKQGSSWKVNHVSRFLITPDYYPFYNSFSASLQEKENGVSDDASRAPEHEYQRRGRLSLLLWFIRRNFFTLFFRILVVILVIWLCFCGGLTFIIHRWLDFSGAMARSNNSSIKRSSSSSSAPDRPSPVVDHHSAANPAGASNKPAPPPSKDEILRKEKHFNGFKPGLFYDGKCWLRNGIRIVEGYKFNNEKLHGDFYGRSVKKIDSIERRYQLDDDTYIDMF